MNRRQEFIDLYTKLHHGGLPDSQVRESIKAIMGISDPRLRAYLSETEHERSFTAPHMTLPQPHARAFPDPLRVPTPNALIISDPHAPFHHRGLLHVALLIARAMEITTVCFTGDVFNFDSINRHPKTGPETNLEEDLRTGGSLLHATSQYMDDIYVMSGNHDANFAKRLDKRFPLDMLIQAALGGKHLQARLHVTDREWIHIGDTWDVGHLSQYARMPGKKAAAIAERRKRNIAVAHDHMQGFMSTPDGCYLGISTGCMLHPNRFWYREQAFNDFPDWKNGFLIIKNDVPYLFHEHGSSPLNGSKPWSYWEQEFALDIRGTFAQYQEDERNITTFNPSTNEWTPSHHDPCSHSS